MEIGGSYKNITAPFLKELLVVAMLLIAYIANIPSLILLAFAASCLLVLFSKYETSVYYLAFFTSFSGIYVYQGRHMYFVLVALFIIRSFFENKIAKKTLLFYLLIGIYCALFSDFGGDFNFAKVIGLFCLFVIPLFADYSDRMDCTKLMKHYIFGFVISTIIGFFAMNIPAMAAVFEYDLMWTEDYQELTRFFGLAFDSNFYALSNYVILAYLLFAHKEKSKTKTILIVFLIISGLQTISKSYMLITLALLILFVLKNSLNVKKLLMTVAIGYLGVILFVYISNKIGYNVIDLVLGRFVSGGSFADNTTGRVDIWGEYFELFNRAGFKDFLFGYGFNASVVDIIGKAAHNTFIEFFFHYGIVGFSLWIAYFAYCLNLFRRRTTHAESKSSVPLLCLIIGIFFLSAYTYEAFWLEIVIAFMTLGYSNKDLEARNV